jgi:Cysteine dioxygenase type I
MTATTVNSSGSGAEHRDAAAAIASGVGDGSGLKPGWGVSPERQQAIAEVMRELAPQSGRLSLAQLRAVTVTLVEHPDFWADLVVYDPDVRWYLPLHRSNSCDVWLLAWERDQNTDWHDHGGSSGSFAVANGSLIEQYRIPSGRRLARRELVVGESVAFGPGHAHDVAHGGGGSACSIHAYSPPLSPDRPRDSGD